MSNFIVAGLQQGLDGDKTTTGATCHTSLPPAGCDDGRGVLRLGDKTTPCPLCGKKEMTLQVKFENLFATDRDFEHAHELSDSDRQDTLNYCRYHLGYQTQLETQSDLDGCFKAYLDSFKKAKH